MGDARQDEQRIDPEWENFFHERVVRRRESLRHLLGTIPVFSLLRAAELKRLSELVHVRDFKTGEVVIRRGVKQSGFYIIRHGSVNIVRDVVGQQQVLAKLKPPELIGEFALLDDNPRSTSIVAAEPSELIGFFKPDLMDIMVTNPGMGCAILLRLAEDMVETLNNDYRKLTALGYPFDDQPAQEKLDPTTS